MRRGRSHRASSVLTLLLLVVLAGGALVVLGLSFIPHQAALGALGRFGISPQPELFGDDAYAAITTRARNVGATYLALFVLVLFARERIVRVLAAGLKGAKRSVARAAIGFRESLNEDRLWVSVVALILLSSVGVRAMRMGLPVRYDEAYTYVNYVRRPVFLALSWYENPNNHLLHTLIAKITVELFGPSLTILRLPALVFGVSSVGLALGWATRVFGRTVGALTGLLVATAPIFVFYSVNARGYSLYVTLFLSGLLFARGIVRRNSPFDYLGFLLVAVLGSYTIPAFAYPLATLGFWIVYERLRDVPGQVRLQRLGTLAAWVIAVIAGGFLVYSPVLVVSGPAAIVSNEFVESLSLGQFVASTPSFVAELWSEWSGAMPVWRGFAAMVLVTLGFVASAALNRTDRSYLYTFAPVLVLGLILGRNFGFPRVWQFLFPVLAGLAVFGIIRVLRLAGTRDRLAAALAGALGLALAVMFVVRYEEPTVQFRDAEPVARFMETEMTREDRLLVYRMIGDEPRASYVPTVRYHALVRNVDLQVLDRTNLADARRLFIYRPKEAPNLEVSTLEELPPAEGTRRVATPVRVLPHGSVYQIVNEREQ